MSSLEPGAIDRLLSGEPPSHRAIALRHAAIHNRPGLRGDNPILPTSVVWLREGDEGTLEAFAAGEPGPMLAWIESQSQGRSIALLAPSEWEAPIRALGGLLSTGNLQTWLRPDALRLPRSLVEVRRLRLDDARCFETSAPAWALRSWGSFESLIEQGAAFGVLASDELLATAWIYESDRDLDKIGVATLPHYQRLGLGLAVSQALVDLIVRERQKHPLWVTTPENLASVALARSLGFSIPVEETLLLWTPKRA